MKEYTRYKARRRGYTLTSWEPPYTKNHPRGRGKGSKGYDRNQRVKSPNLRRSQDRIGRESVIQQ